MGSVVDHLRGAPVTVLLLLAVGVFIAWVPDDGGQPLTTWVPGALLLAGLLAVALLALPGRWSAAPRPVRAAVVLLGAFTAWSALSILWADDQGSAWQGTNRTLLYLIVFALFALWPQRSTTASWVLGAWTLAMGVLAVATLLKVAGDDPLRMFVDDRLTDPAGYPNAAAATWMMVLWPAVTLAAAPRVPWALRGTFAALAVVLAEVALLSQSRGSVIAAPLTLLVLIAVVPDRLRHLAVLVPVGAAVAAAAPAVIDLGPPAADGDVAAAAAQADVVARHVLLAAVAAGLVVALAAWAAGRRPVPPQTAVRARRAWGATVVAVAVVGAVVGLIVVGNPVERAGDAWDSFKGGYQTYDETTRLTSGLGSNRYDFFRVALNQFRDHPLVGVGVDNYFQDYLAEGDSPETPRYPHNVVLRTLAQTGIVGFLILVGALAAALAAAWRGMRAGGPLGTAVAGGATIAFTYWLIHGTADWFWEWAGLGAPAFALLGLAASLAPRRVESGAQPPMLRSPAAAVGGTAALAAAALAMAAPWLAERDVQRAAEIYDRDPMQAYQRLDRAGRWDPLSDRPALVEGSIALRYGDLDRAEAAFRKALERNPRSQYATLELGAIASVRGRRDEALARLRRATALAPRDQVAAEALAVVRSGGAVDIAALNDRILSANRQLAR